ncbi:MAG: serine hydrolase [Ignavibacteriae bacterium]|nr:serine hydrolase [Ignavibacteriota bacterium]
MNSLFNKLICALFFCATICNQVNAQPFNAKLAAKLQETLDTQVATFTNTKGASASVYYPGQGIWKGAAGLSYSGNPITTDMEFGLASNTKLFTAVAILKLAEANILSLNDQLYKWIPKYNNVDSTITIRQLLNHTTGIADIFTTASMAYIESNPSHSFTTAEVMAWVGPKLFNPGTGFGYSNTNYFLAGLIAESATGVHISKIIRDSILAPLQLDSTFFDGKETVNGTIAHPWENGVDKFNISRTALNTLGDCAGSMYSTASEMAEWYQALMSGRVISANSLNEITTFLSPGNYGFGLMTTQLFGRPEWTHGGTNTGYNSRMFYDPVMKVTVCGLSNSNPSAIDGAITGILLKTITDNLPAPAGAIIGAISVCQGQNSVQYTVSPISNAVSYTWTFPNGSTETSATNSISVNYDKSSVSGNISVVGTNSYGDGLSSSLSITVQQLPTVTFKPTLQNKLCHYSAPIVLQGGNPLGGVYSGIGVKDGIFDPSVSGTGDFTVTYSFTNPNGCVNSDSSIISVQPKPSVVFKQQSKNTLCAESSPLPLSGGTPAGGIYSGIGVTDEMFDPAISGAGEFMITYSYADSIGCINSDSIQLKVVPKPIVTYNKSINNIFCTNTPPITLTNGKPIGGTYSGKGMKNGMFDPTLSGVGDFTVIYSFADSNGCSSMDSGIITVNPITSSTITTTASDSYTLNGQIYTQTGTYTQVLKNNAGCDSTVTLNLTITTTSVLEFANETGFEIYPNPSSGKFVIESKLIQNKLRPVEIEIYTVLGTKIFATVLIGLRTEIQPNLSKGIYIYRLQDGATTYCTGKLVIGD